MIGSPPVARVATTRERAHGAAALAGLFVLSRLALDVVGVTFDGTTAAWYWQYLDLDLLRTRLAESLYYLHAQPPLFNLALGLALKLPADWTLPALHAGMLTASLVAAAAVHDTLLAFGVRPIVALAVSTALIVTPCWIVAENVFMYDLPVASLLAVAGWFVARWPEPASTRRGVALGLGLALAALCLTRSLFHVIYLAGLLTARWWLPDRTRSVVLAAVVALALTVPWYAKNLMVFGRFTASTWLGMNLYKTVDTPVQGADTGAISPVRSIPAFSTLDRYPPALRESRPWGAVPALALAVKAGGAPNFNHAAYLRISDEYTRLWIDTVRNDPAAYVYGVAKAGYWFTHPFASGPLVETTFRQLGWYGTAWLRGAWARIDLPVAVAGKRVVVYPGLAVVLVAAIAGLTGLAWRLRPPAGGDPQAYARVALYTIAYVVLAGTLFDSGENFRFQFYLWPFFAVSLGVTAEGVLTRWTGGAAGALPRNL